MNYKNRIKELRKQKGVSQDELAKHLGVTRQSISYYENEDRSPSKKIWEKLSNFFKVSVPYIQGKSYSEEEMIELIHECYFSKWFQSAGSPSGLDFYPAVNAENDVDLYISMTSEEQVYPKNLYPKGAKEHPLTQEAKKLWEKHFGYLFKQFVNRDVSKEIGNVEMISMILDAIKRVNSYLGKKRADTTPLGIYFDNECGDEEDFHKKAIYNVRFADLENAKKEFNEYFKYIKYLKNKIDNFSPKNYFDKIIDFDNTEFKKHFGSSKNYNKFSHERNKIISEINNRVENGDKALRDFILKNSGEYPDVTNAYADFKDQNNEDASELEKFSSLFEEDQ